MKFLLKLIALFLIAPGILMAHSVTLNWTASVDAVDGYNVYRGTAAGAETTLLNTGLVTATTFVDANPIETAFYVARAVRAGVESVNSNEISVILPVAPPTGLSGIAH